jgi:hypothetical protein
MKENENVTARTGNEDELLSKLLLDRRLMDDYQVLCLPENFDGAASIDELYDTRDGINLCKKFRDNGLKSGNSFDLKIHNNFYGRKSLDIWLGTLWVLDKLVLPLVVSIVGSIIGPPIYTHIKGKMQKERRPPNLLPIAHFTLIIRKGNELQILEFKGDSAAVISSLDKLVKEF